MRFLITVLFSTFLAIVGFSQLAIAADESMEVLKSADGAMQLSVPTSGKWESQSTEDNNFSLFLVSKEKHRSLIVTVLEREESGFSSLKEAMQASLDKSKSTGVSITANPAPCEISGLECSYMEMEKRYPNKGKLADIANLVAIAAGSNYFYFFVATSDPEHYAQNKKDFLSILSSIKETEAAKAPKAPAVPAPAAPKEAVKKTS